MDNPDGSCYKDHKLQLFEWDVARESSYILAMTAMAIDILQSTKTVTISLLLPVIGRLTYNLKADTPVKHNGNFVQITSLEVQEARELLRKDIIRRYDSFIFHLLSYLVSEILVPHGEACCSRSFSLFIKVESKGGDFAR